jgi:release factor glutamine methyltransferase
MPPTIAAALRTQGIDAIDARVLLEHVLGLPHAALIAHADRALSNGEYERFRDLVERRRRGEPVAYLIGWREFYGRRFALTPSVLIPRPETEVLVEQALARFHADARIRVLDLGTGSGNIAITLALERPDWMVTALDWSPAALAVARGNARSLGAGSIEWLQGDWYGPVAGRAFDLIVSNPPYVAQFDPHLHDLRFEPSAALCAGPDGLAAIRRIVAGAGAHLVPQGWLLFEHGFDQAQACASLLAQAGFTSLTHARDLAGLRRVSGGRLQ